MNSKLLVLVCAGVLAVMAPRARADQWNERTVFTFSAPVEIPGQVLTPGTYVFKLVDSESNRDIVQVFSKNEKHLYGTFLAIPDYHLRPSGKTIITFEERAAGAPEAVKAWFYPGDNYGHEFVYPKAKAVALAQANNQPVASMPNEMAATTTQPAPNANAAPMTALKQTTVMAQQPSQQEVEVTQVFPLPPQGHTHAQAAAPPQEQAQNEPPALPKTASPIPLIALSGLASLVAAGAVRRFARR